MSLRAIVAALGGDLYQNGTRANVPAPGHSAADRSVSLMLSEGRVVVHGFGGADWKAARDWLRECGLIDAHGRPAGNSVYRAPTAFRPDRARRVDTARRLWDEAAPLGPHDAATRHLARRRVKPPAMGLRFHPAAPLSVFAPASTCRPALVARIDDGDGRLTAVELVYLEANGLRAVGLRLSRKTVGAVPAGSAVRLHAIGPTLAVGEGVMTVLSAGRRFGAPAWALLSVTNMARWRPPPGVRRLLVAADRGAAGEAAACRLRAAALAMGVEAEVRLPPAPFGDWNAADGGEEGRGR